MDTALSNNDCKVAAISYPLEFVLSLNKRKTSWGACPKTILYLLCTLSKLFYFGLLSKLIDTDLNSDHMLFAAQILLSMSLDLL